MHAFCRSNHIPYKIKYSANAICWSQVPNNLADLRKQRRRWHIGLFQSVNAHKQILFNPVYGALAFVSFLYFLIYELLSPYIEAFGIICTIVAIYFNLINVRYMLTIMYIYVIFSGIMSLAAFFARVHSMSVKIHFWDIVKAIGLCLVENVFLRLVLAYTRMTALIGYKSKKNSWGKITREKIKTNSFEEIL